MKLTSLAIVFVIIISPFLFISAQTSKTAIEDQRLRTYYDNIIDNAIQDAAYALSQKALGEISDARESAVEVFFDTMYYSFNAYTNLSSKARVDACVPVLVFLEKEGFSLYALNPYKDTHGQTDVKHIWFPIQHYIGEPLSGRFSVRYTLDNRVYVYDQIDKLFSQGDYQEYKDRISFFNDTQTFETLRIAAVKNSVQEEIMSYMNQYNQWASGKSLYVRLEFPSIDDSDWKRALTDEGILVFAQGFPVLSGKNYRHYALGGARVIRKAPIIGYTFHGLFYYCRTDCEYYQNTILTDPGFNKDSILHFSDACEAAENGHFPCPNCD